MTKWDRIPPQNQVAGLESPRFGVNKYTEHLEMLQEVAYTPEVYKHINGASAAVWLRVLAVSGGIQNALVENWRRGLRW